MDSEKENTLRVNLSPSRPVELADFLKSCSAILSEYNSFAESKDPEQNKLYIKEVRKGSIEIDLVTQVGAGIFAFTQTVMPFMEDVNVIGQFTEYLKGVFDWLKKGGDRDERKYSLETIKNAGDILTPVAKDENASITFSPVVNIKGNVNAPLTILCNDSRLIQEASHRLLSESCTPNREHFDDVVLKWVQVRNNTNIKDKRYKSVIPAICDREVSTLFADKSLMAIFREDKSFFKSLWLASVFVERIDGVPKLYKIEKIERLEDED